MARGSPGRAIGSLPLDRNGLVVLDREECVALLRSVSVARIGATMGALPVVLPVNVAFWDRDEPELVIRSVEGSKLQSAIERAVVAVEADAIDPVTHSGWSVLVQGQSRVLVDDQEITEASHLPLRPWATAGADRFITVGLDVVSGRRLLPGNVAVPLTR